MKTVVHVREGNSTPKKNRHFLVRPDTEGVMLQIMLADDQGNPIDYCPYLFSITARGELRRAECVNKQVAKDYGLQLDDQGRIVLE